MLDLLLSSLVASNPAVVQGLLVMSLARLIFKPACAAYIQYVHDSESKEDDSKLDAFLAHPVVKNALWLLDLALSIKLPPKKQE